MRTFSSTEGVSRLANPFSNPLLSTRMFSAKRYSQKSAMLGCGHKMGFSGALQEHSVAAQGVLEGTRHGAFGARSVDLHRPRRH